MKNSFGQSVILTLFGESHGSAVGCVIDGLSPGIDVREENIARALSRRRPSSAVDTARREKDDFKILSGVFAGKTTGTPITIVIPNEDTRSKDYNYGVARPSHADYAAFCKYHGYEDYRGGGHFSGRITAGLVAAGGIIIPALQSIGISVGTHIKKCAGISDREFGNMQSDIAALADKTFPVLDDGRGEQMTKAILAAASEGDSVGGITQTAIVGVPAGVGEPWFDSVEGILSHALFSIGGVKGVEFGLGFASGDLRGSEFNDQIRVVSGEVETSTNHNGGINGGITNGMPIVFSCAVKPTPSIAKQQETINFLAHRNAELSIKGRHDPAIIRRACPVIDSVAALCIADMLCVRYGDDVLRKGVNEI